MEILENNVKITSIPIDIPTQNGFNFNLYFVRNLIAIYTKFYTNRIIINVNLRPKTNKSSLFTYIIKPNNKIKILVLMWRTLYCNENNFMFVLRKCHVTLGKQIVDMDKSRIKSHCLHYPFQLKCPVPFCVKTYDFIQIELLYVRTTFWMHIIKYTT